MAMRHFIDVNRKFFGSFSDPSDVILMLFEEVDSAPDNATKIWCEDSWVDDTSLIEQDITSAGTLTIPHNLHFAPTRVNIILVCVTGDAGYTAGDLLIYHPSSASLGAVDNVGVSIVSDATNLTVRFGSNAQALCVIHKTSGDSALLTNANWKIRFIPDISS